VKNTPGKAPSHQWYYKDWMGDGELQMASCSTRGIWMNILCTMMDESVQKRTGNDGTIRTNLHGIMRLGGCTKPEAELFIEEARLFGFCEIALDNCGNVQIMSRRINRESKQRTKWRNIKRKQREKEPDKKPVLKSSNEIPPTSSIPSPTSYSSKAKSNNDFDTKKTHIEPDIAQSSKLAAQRLQKFKADQKNKPKEKPKWGKE
jgi:hypothetical protein